MMTGEYDSGKKIGVWRTYYDNGQVESEGPFDDGKRSGNWKWYFPDGRLDSDRSGEYNGFEKVEPTAP